MICCSAWDKYFDNPTKLILNVFIMVSKFFDTSANSVFPIYKVIERRLIIFI